MFYPKPHPDLVAAANVPATDAGPTSYPTTPYWEAKTHSAGGLKLSVKKNRLSKVTKPILPVCELLTLLCFALLRM